MGLIDLQTNLKSLKYGDFGNRTGNQPYIGTGDEIPTNPPGAQPDFLLRGGHFQTAKTDTSRILKFFQDGDQFRGPGFIVKQNSLELLNPKVPGYPNNNIYSPTSTLAQVAGAGTGLHLEKQGLLPNFGQFNTYEKRIQNLNKEDKSQLSLLWKSKIASSGNISFNKDGDKFGLDTLNPLNIKNYLGGPGIVRTQIPRVINTQEWIDKSLDINSNLDYILPSYNLIEVLSNETTNNRGTSINFIQRFTDENTRTNEVERKKKLSTRLTSTNYQNFNRAKTYGEGNPGNPNKDLTNYYIGAPKSTGGEDQINVARLYEGEEINETLRDLDTVKFYIEAINNDEPAKRTYLHFRAFVTGFSDSFNASWNPTRFTGRGNDFYTYGGFSRAIGLSFQVPVLSRVEQLPLYEKLNYLASLMAPDYSPSTGFMRGNIIRLTFGDYMSRVPGIITQLNYQIPDDASWDIARLDDGILDEDSFQLPMMINVGSFAFTPIHDFIPGRVPSIENSDSIIQKFISLQNTSGKDGYQILNNA
jgi:hypothetical protein